MTSRFDPVWRSLEQTIASGWAPGLVAGVRHDGETEIFATGTLAFDSPRQMTVDTPFRIASLSKLVSGALAATMIADGTLALDEPVDDLLPELANARVLAHPDGPLDDTVPAERAITLRHLLTLTHGLGVIFAQTPLSTAMLRAGVSAGPIPPQLSGDEYLARIGTLPLAYQPGERWTYNNGTDILSILLARAANAPLHDVVAERITTPLGMHSTAFFGDASKLPTAYVAGAEGLAVFDKPDGPFSAPPPFESLAGGLVSTVPDYLKFLSALADGTLLRPDLQHQMTSPQLTPEQRIGMVEMGDANASWGWQVGVVTAGTGAGKTPGSYGWTGGTGTSAFVDPTNDLIGAVFTQRLMSGPADTFDYFTDPLAATL